MPGSVFISYRRGDDPGHAGRLFDSLLSAFGPKHLFMDVDNIEPGQDFVKVLEEKVAQTDVLLAVIGSRWVDALGPNGERRIENPQDFVRLEIEAALSQNKKVIPVLVGDAKMPGPEQLPESLRVLARLNAVRVSHERFRSDIEGLVRALRKILNQPAPTVEWKRLFQTRWKLVSAAAGLTLGVSCMLVFFLVPSARNTFGNWGKEPDQQMAGDPAPKVASNPAVEAKALGDKPSGSKAAVDNAVSAKAASDNLSATGVVGANPVGAKVAGDDPAQIKVNSGNTVGIEKIEVPAGAKAASDNAAGSNVAGVNPAEAKAYNDKPALAAPPVKAPAYCENLKRVIKSGEQYFETIKIKKITTEDLAPSKVQLEGWNDCYLAQLDNKLDSRYFVCRTAPVQSSVLQSMMDKTVVDLKICLGDTWTLVSRRTYDGQIAQRFFSVSKARVELRPRKDLAGDWVIKLDVSLN